jgi:hypothetical protein
MAMVAQDKALDLNCVYRKLLFVRVITVLNIPAFFSLRSQFMIVKTNSAFLDYGNLAVNSNIIITRVGFQYFEIQIVSARL